MGTIADKLLYLNGTKQLFKTDLNAVGAEITDQTTFRNYLQWLDDLYDSTSEKTKLAEEGIEGNTKQSILPSEYTQVDYIESSGTQYIDTGYKPNQNTRMTTKIYVNSLVGKYDNVGGARNGNTNQFHIIIANTRFGAKYHTQGAIYVTTPTGLHTFDFNKNQIYIDNNLVKTFSSDTFTSDYNAYIFAVNNGGSATQKANYKLYNMKWYDNDTLVRDFIPCYRNSDNEVGLYDLVNDVFYTNQGTDAFTYGSKTPTPDTPQEIVNISGKSNVKIVGKNKLPFPYAHASTTNYGVTFTVQNDGSVLVNGTANGGNGSIKLYGDYLTIDNKELPGKYISGGTNEVNLRALNNIDGSYTLLANDTGNGAEINTSTYKKGYIELFVRNGTTVNNVLIKPMILDSLDDTTYEPYQEQSFDLDLKSKNLFDGILEIGNFNSNTGEKIANHDYIINTNPIPVEELTNYKISSNGTGIRMYVFEYKEDMTYNLSTRKTVNADSYLTTNSGTKYINFRTIDANTNLQEKIQVEKGTASSDYEPYYDINLCKIGDYKDRIFRGSGKNLFDKNNALTLPAYIGANSGTITSSDGDKCLYIPCKPNTQYTISKISSLRFRAGFTDNIPVLTSVCNPYSGNKDTETSITLSSSTNSNYLIVFYWTLSDTLTEQQILDSIQIEENSIPTDYEPFGKVWYLEKKIGKISFSDSDLNSCSVNGMTSTFAEYLSPIIDDIKPSMGETSQVSFSNITNVFRGTTSTKKIRFRISHEILGTTSSSTNEEAKTAFLNKMTGKTLIFYYILATPTTEEITESNYPTLYEQLQEIQDYLIQYKINKEFLLGYVEPSIKIQ